MPQALHSVVASSAPAGVHPFLHMGVSCGVGGRGGRGGSGWFRRASPRVGEERNPRALVQSHHGEASFERRRRCRRGARGARRAGRRGDAPCACTPRWRTSCPCSRAGAASRVARVETKEARARGRKCEPHAHHALVAGRVPSGGEGLAEGQPGRSRYSEDIGHEAENHNLLSATSSLAKLS